MVFQNAQKKRNILRWVLAVLLSLILLFLGTWLLLFRVNRFELVLELNGEEEITISQGDSYSDPGAAAKLVGSLFFREGIAVDVSCSVIGEVDTSAVGTYQVTYHTIFRGMKGYAQRTVHVLDITPPEITLTAIPGSYTIPGDAYAEEGYSAWDNCDGDISDRVIRVEQDGFVTYTVTDRAGNRTTLGRKIYYFDPVPPELTLVGEGTFYITSGEGYSEPGWTAQDNADGDLSSRVQVTGSVDRYLAGSYQLCYSVKDDSGNCAEVYRTVIVQAKKRPETVTPTGKVIYLTFDDGPGPYTEELLEILEEYGAKATFFVVDSDHADVICDIVEEGHSIGIHSVTHSYREIYASADAYFQDLLTMQQIIYDLTGVRTYLMRFPGGSSNTVSRFNPGIMTYLSQAVEDMGFQYFDWNVDSNDAGGARDAEEVFENVTSGAERRRISIVLQHDIKDFSVEAVEKILQWGQENGYQFLGLDMTSPTAHHGVNN